MSHPLPELSGVSHKFITINGSKIHVAEAGRGKPLLLIHGWPQHWYIWRKIIPLLANDYHLIMPDLPGFGWSDPPKNDDFRKEQLARAMIDLLDALHLKQVTLVGHDWGGWIGFLACLQKSEKFHNYLALGITNPLTNAKLTFSQSFRFLYQIPIALPFIGETLLRFFPSLTEWALKKCIFRKDILSQKELELYSHVLQDPLKAKASSLMYRTFLLQELIPILRGKYKQQKLLVPTRLLIGENDPVIHPSLFTKLHKASNTLAIEIIPHCGHFIPEEQPEIVAKRIRSFN